MQAKEKPFPVYSLFGAGFVGQGIICRQVCQISRFLGNAVRIDPRVILTLTPGFSRL
jgi:hypothetical protein